jgi:hypothetical protein
VQVAIQILSRILAVILVALPLAGLRRLLDDVEREAIAKMNHQDLIAFVKEAHTASYFGAYFQALCVLLIFVGAVELIAFLIRCVAGLFAAPGRVPVRERELVSF